MATSNHPVSEAESCADSVSSSPRSATFSRGSDADYHQRWAEDGQPRVRFMCSFGGRILPRPHDNQLRYVGGETRIVAASRNTTFAGLLAKLSKIAGDDVTVKYQLPNEDLDALISVTTDEDVENMMEEYDRLSVSGGRAARLRLFLFPARSEGLGAFLDESKRGDWFVDALNAGDGSSRGPRAPGLERRRSEASSVVSDVPDFLFGLDQPDNLDDSGQRHPAAIPKSKLGQIAGDQAFVPDHPGSPVRPLNHSSSSAISVPPIPDLPPLKIKPEGKTMSVLPPSSTSEAPTRTVEAFQNPTFVQQEQAWRFLPDSHFPAGNPAAAPVPVYYFPAGAVPLPYAQHMVPTSTIPPASLPLPTAFRPRVPAGQIYRTMPQEIRPAGDAYEFPAGVIHEGALPQPLYYAPRAPFPAYSPGVPPAPDVLLPDMMGRVSQGQQK